jgi:hypothetical protein
MASETLEPGSHRLPIGRNARPLTLEGAGHGVYPVDWGAIVEHT